MILGAKGETGGSNEYGIEELIDEGDASMPRKTPTVTASANPETT
jgi:hypothetical protein